MRALCSLFCCNHIVKSNKAAMPVTRPDLPSKSPQEILKMIDAWGSLKPPAWESLKIYDKEFSSLLYIAVTYLIETMELMNQQFAKAQKYFLELLAAIDSTNAKALLIYNPKEPKKFSFLKTLNFFIMQIYTQGVKEQRITEHSLQPFFLNLQVFFSKVSDEALLEQLKSHKKFYPAFMYQVLLNIKSDRIEFSILVIKSHKQLPTDLFVYHWKHSESEREAVKATKSYLHFFNSGIKGIFEDYCQGFRMNEMEEKDAESAYQQLNPRR